LSAVALVIESQEPAPFDNDCRVVSRARIEKIGGRSIPHCDRRLASRAASAEIYEARIEAVICITYFAKNESRRASRASAIEIDRGGCANSTHYIERRRICETGVDAGAVDSYRSKVIDEDIVRRSELKGADLNHAGRRNRRRKSPAECGGSVRARDSRRIPVGRSVPVSPRPIPCCILGKGHPGDTVQNDDWNSNARGEIERGTRQHRGRTQARPLRQRQPEWPRAVYATTWLFLENPTRLSGCSREQCRSRRRRQQMCAHLAAPAAEMSQRRLAEAVGHFCLGGPRCKAFSGRATTIALRLWFRRNIFVPIFYET
jgi:hypothetical protein